MCTVRAARRLQTPSRTGGRMTRLIASLGLVAALASSAFATDIYNQDAKAYKITIVDGSYTSSKDLDARASIYGLCTTGPCTFKIKGSSIVAGKDEKLVINGGKL